MEEKRKEAIRTSLACVIFDQFASKITYINTQAHGYIQTCIPRYIHISYILIYKAYHVCIMYTCMYVCMHVCMLPTGQKPRGVETRNFVYL